ncbi:hypothetical protein [Trebonia kvetii]|uniref:hypothetical protein n=1 Tax=Trebonia kvetii TaxID=2480626 RepID=UPI001651FF46|nr:hypothetical protein [Trebonia kvetii]
MEVASAGRPARHAVLPAAALVLAAALSGCKGQLAVSAPGASTAASEPAAAPAATSAPATGPAAGPPASSAVPASVATSQAPGTGNVSVSVTSPVTLSGSTAVPVSCATGPGYRAQVSSAVIHGDQVSYTVAIARYRGPGSYPAAVAVTLRQSTGVVTTVAGVSRVPVAISSAGGSFSVSATGTGGRTFTGSLAWTCGT